MVSYTEQVKTVIRKSDVIIEVVDARFPMDSRNFELEKLIKRLRKKYIIIVNKSDLVPEAFLKKVVNVLSKETRTIHFSAIQKKGIRLIFSAIRTLRKDKKTKIGIIGYPNVGKSTIINMLKGRHSALTASKPGHTKGLQFLRLDKNTMLVDTPGVLPIKGKKSAILKGCLPFEQIKNIEASMIAMISDFKDRGVGHMVEEQYDIPLDDLDTYLERFAKKYGYLQKGGILDTERAAKRIYHDWLKGRLSVYWL